MCEGKGEKNVQVNFEWKITWHVVLERIFEASNIVPRGQSTTSCISAGARVSQFEASNIVPRGQSTTSCISAGARVSQFERWISKEQLLPIYRTP